MSYLRSNGLLLLIFAAFISFGQNPKGKVSIELSIPHTREIPRINRYSIKDNAFVIIHNNTDSVHYFYEDWNSYGYFNISFEIKYRDSIFTVVRPPKLWYRNFKSYHTVQPHESLVFPHILIDTSYAKALWNNRVYEDGWLGIPAFSDTVEIRAVYQLCHLEDSIPDEIINITNYRRNDYTDYLDGDIESELYEPSRETQKPKLPDPNPVLIFNEPLFSEWQQVIL